jgi:hypothetical protein
MFKKPFIRVIEDPKIVVVCDSCHQKLRIPRSRRRIQVTCPSCRHQFKYQYFGLGISSYSLRQLLKKENIRAFKPAAIALLGLALFGGGAVLGAASRNDPSHAYLIAGLIISAVGLALMVLAYKKL